MKRFISLILSLTMIAGLCAAFSVSAAEEAKAPKITVDGKLDDWQGTHTLSVVGTGEFDGKKVTFYGTVTDEGIYLAADAYHAIYATNASEWWQNTNFEFFVDRAMNRDDTKQMWVSAKGMGENDTTPLKSRTELNAVMITKAEQNGAAAYHTIAEVFIPKTIDFVASNIINGNARVGIAWKTLDDKINNSEAGDSTEYWMPKGTYPDNRDKAIVNARGIFKQAEPDYGGYGINATFYSNSDHDALKAALPKGSSGRENDTNGAQCIPENFRYAESIDNIMKLMKEERTRVIETIADAATWGDFYLVELDGYISPNTTGDYTFGAYEVDNCFYMQINETTVYEFWANDIYNANGAGGNTYTSSISLEAGKIYKFKAVFLEIDGGEVINLNAKIGSGEAKSVNELFTFTTSHEHEWSDVKVTKEATCGKAGEGTQTCEKCGEQKKVSIPATGEHTYVDGVCSVCGAKENESPKTGDMTVLVSVIAIVSLVGAAVVVSKKRIRSR